MPGKVWHFVEQRKDESDAAVRIVGGASKKSIYSQKAIEAPWAKKKKPFWKFW